MPLVVDLGSGDCAGLISGWPTAGAEASYDPDDLTVSRPGWDLIRLQRRFGGRVLLLSSAAPDLALWVADILGLGTRLIRLETDDPAEKRRVVTDQFTTRQFDVLGHGKSLGALGQEARRLWLVGQDEGLRRRMLTLGARVYFLDDLDRVVLRHLMRPIAAGGSWQLDQDDGRGGFGPDVRRAGGNWA